MTHTDLSIISSRVCIRMRTYGALKTAISILCFLVANCTYAQDASVYEIDWSKDKYYITGGLAVLGTDYFLLQKQKIITEQYISGLNTNDISSFDRSAIFNNSTTARDISDQFRNFCVLFPFVTVLSKQGKSEWEALSIMYLETLIINTAITSLSKVMFTRTRPFVYNENIPIEQKLNKDAQHSFFSGHVSTVSAMSFFTATVLSDLHPDSKYKWLWWSGAASIPAIAAYTRYEAGRHFPTDVIVGYGVGAIIGYLIPKIHKVDSNKLKLDVIPSQTSVSLSLKYTL